MPDHRKHRGPHPEDARLFAPQFLPALCAATADLCWLLSRGYATPSSLKLVGDRYDLVARQRTAVGRSAASDAEAIARQSRRVDAGQVAVRTLWLDGYNVLTTVEAALAGSVVLAARDGTFRDMASMHGSYRKVAETRPALELIGKTLAGLSAGNCVWYLDRPVSNSGRLKQLIGEVAAAQGWPWRVDLVLDPDDILIELPSQQEGEVVVATADSVILNRCGPWLNLARETVVRHVPEAWVVAMGASAVPAEAAGSRRTPFDGG